MPDALWRRLLCGAVLVGLVTLLAAGCTGTSTPRGTTPTTTTTTKQPGDAKGKPDPERG